MAVAVVVVVVGGAAAAARGEGAPRARENAAAAVVGGQLVVAGGCTAAVYAHASAEGRGLATGARAWLPPMPRAASGAAAAAIGGRLYVAGGADEHDAELDALQVWDGAAWTERAPMPRRRMDAACAAVGGRLVVLGGWVCGEGTTASVVAYDPRADAWSAALAPLPAPRAYFAAIIAVSMLGAHLGFLLALALPAGGGAQSAVDTCCAIDVLWGSLSLLACEGRARHTQRLRSCQGRDPHQLRCCQRSDGREVWHQRLRPYRPPGRAHHDRVR